MKEVSTKMAEAKAVGADQATMNELVLRQRSIIKKSGAKFSHQFFAMPVQMSIAFGSFIAARRLCELSELSHSGFWLVPDLTAPSPVWMPLVSLLLVAASMRVSPFA